MIKVFILFFTITLSGCEESTKVYQSESGWYCTGRNFTFQFNGENAQQKAHERCDSMLLPYNKLNQRGKDE